MLKRIVVLTLDAMACIMVAGGVFLMFRPAGIVTAGLSCAIMAWQVDRLGGESE